MSKTELQELLDTALLQRKKAYKIGAPKVLISCLNYDIRRFRQALAEVA